jgi:hypothetical protein
VSLNSANLKDKTLEEREEEYAKARARIFGSEKVEPLPLDDTCVPQSPSGASTPTNISPRDRKPEEDTTGKQKSKKFNDVDNPLDFYRGTPENWSALNRAMNSQHVDSNSYNNYDPAYNRNFVPLNGYPNHPTMGWYPMYHGYAPTVNGQTSQMLPEPFASLPMMAAFPPQMTFPPANRHKSPPGRLQPGVRAFFLLHSNQRRRDMVALTLVSECHISLQRQHQ